MTGAPSEDRGRQRSGSVRVALDGSDAGTVLGALAWVMGALEIMKDRGHAGADEEFHDLYDALTPQLNHVVALVSGGRSALGPDDPLQAEIDAAYTTVREAFERWIQLTASDTAEVALGQRLAAALGDIPLDDIPLDDEDQGPR